MDLTFQKMYVGNNILGWIFMSNEWNIAAIANSTYFGTTSTYLSLSILDWFTFSTIRMFLYNWILDIEFYGRHALCVCLK